MALPYQKKGAGKMYRYFIIKNVILRIYSWKVKVRSAFPETCKELYDRAEKYGYKQFPYD